MTRYALAICPGCGKRRAVRTSTGITTCVKALRPDAADLAGLGDRLAGTSSVSPERHGGDSTLPRPAGAPASHAAQVGRSRAG